MRTVTTRIGAILAASDLGPASDEVVRTAAALAGRLGAELHLLNALEIERLPAMEAPIYPKRVEQAEDLLAEQAQRLSLALDARHRVVLDYVAHKAIQSRAADVGAGLIVIGPHRGGDVGARILGTTAEQVLRGAEVPVLVVRGRLHLPLRCIGVPTDFSVPADRALDVALALLERLGREDGPEIRLFHVASPAERVEGMAALERNLASQAEAAEGRADGAPHVLRTEVLRGERVTDAICDHAGNEAMDLLVTGTQGKSGLRRLVLGSVAAGVARQAHCPVLLVPPSPGAGGT